MNFCQIKIQNDLLAANTKNFGSDLFLRYKLFFFSYFFAIIISFTGYMVNSVIN